MGVRTSTPELGGTQFKSRGHRRFMGITKTGMTHPRAAVTRFLTLLKKEFRRQMQESIGSLLKAKVHT